MISLLILHIASDILGSMAKRKAVLVQMNDDLLAKLDRLAGEVGRSRSAVVRDAVERYVVQESIAEKDRRMVEGYTRIPDDDEFDAWAEWDAEDLVREEPW